VMLGEFITSSHAKKGGPCPECGLAIGMFNRIFKYTVIGQSGTTVAGNGAGVWVCSFCHDRHKPPLEIQPFICSACDGLCNPGVMVGGRLLCERCYGHMAVEAGRLL